MICIYKRFSIVFLTICLPSKWACFPLVTTFLWLVTLVAIILLEPVLALVRGFEVCLMVVGARFLWLHLWLVVYVSSKVTADSRQSIFFWLLIVLSAKIFVWCLCFVRLEVWLILVHVSTEITADGGHSARLVDFLVLSERLICAFFESNLLLLILIFVFLTGWAATRWFVSKTLVVWVSVVVLAAEALVNYATTSWEAAVHPTRRVALSSLFTVTSCCF